MIRNGRDIFHVHTYRCKHAGDEKDELYIKRAVELGAQGIFFTDHAPFPGNPFGNRMGIEDLQEYVSTLSDLKEKYKEDIKVNIGLEIEYLPGFQDYYAWLNESKYFDVLMIGQHLYECGEGKYSFSLNADVLKREEAENLCCATIEGMLSGYFQVVAHPDRMFRKCECWDSNMEKLSLDMIKVAEEKKIILEKNLSSMGKKNQYWEEFWGLVPDTVDVITGVDAHSVDELDKAILK